MAVQRPSRCWVSARLRLDFTHAEFLQAGAVLFQFVGAQFAATGVGGQFEGEVQVAAATGAHAGGEVDGEGADHQVAGQDLLGVEMIALAVDCQPLALRPFDRAGVAADKPVAAGKRRAGNLQDWAPVRVEGVFLRTYL